MLPSPAACALGIALLAATPATAQPQARPGELTALLTSGIMNLDGIRSTSISRTLQEQFGAGLGWKNARVYRSAQRILFELNLQLLEGDTQPWTLGNAALVDERGKALEMLSMHFTAPLRKDTPNGWLRMEAMAPASKPLGTFTLKVWEKDGTRTLTLDGVTFP